MNKIEHIGIAVANLEEAIPRFEQLLATVCYKQELVASEGVQTAFFQLGTNKIELLQSVADDGVIARFVAKRGEGLHHIAYAVTDILAEMKRLQAEGFRLLSNEPKPGADNKLICFVHPKDTHGVLTELCQER